MIKKGTKYILTEMLIQLLKMVLMNRIKPTIRLFQHFLLNAIKNHLRAG